MSRLYFLRDGSENFIMTFKKFTNLAFVDNPMTKVGVAVYRRQNRDVYCDNLLKCLY